MLLEFFRFDLRYQLRQPLLWVVCLIFGLMAFGASSSDSIQIGGAVGNIDRNAPLVIVRFLGFFTILSLFIVTVFIAGAVLRDNELGMADLLFATPMKKRDYLGGRFLAGLTACLAIFLLVSVGLMLGPLMPWVDKARLGAFSLLPYAWGFAVFVLPNLLFIGALLMLLAVTTRSMLMVYVGVIAFFVLWTIAGVFTKEISNEWLYSLIDPFGMRAFGRMTRYYSVAEANAVLPPVSGFLLANRALWGAVGLGLFAAAFLLFKPQRAGTGRALFGRNAKQAAAAAAPAGVALRPAKPMHGAATPWRQCWRILRFDAAGVFKSVPFLVMLLFSLVNFIASAILDGKVYGTQVYPVSYLMLETLSNSFSFMLVIIVTFYAGELIFKERQAGMADVVDAMPLPNWVPLVAKSLALLGVISGFLGTGALAAIGFQLVRGGAPVEPLLYLKELLLATVSFALMGLIGIALQVLCNNKFIGYLAMIVLMIVQVVLPILDFEHNLYRFAGIPGGVYSDMNGFGHFLTGWSWYSLYWGLFVLAMLIVAQAFWVRGLSQEWRTRVRIAGQRLRGPSGVGLAAALAAFVATGGWIYYNANVLNFYQPGDKEMDEQSRYEKQYRQYKDAPHPRVTDIQADVDIFASERRVAIKGRYTLENKLGVPLDTLHVQATPHRNVETVIDKLPPHKVVTDDKELGFRIFKLERPLAPGDKLDFGFRVDVRYAGFTNDGKANSINLNGTFFNHTQFFPLFGYNTHFELQDRNERRKRGLGEPQRMAKLEDEAARANSLFGSMGDWVNFDTTVSTDADQIALAPGYLQKSWEEKGRRYFRYTMDRPMVPFFAYLSARWQIKKGEWRGLPIEVYHDPKHGYNVDRMIEATQKSLDYFSANFTPYQHKQVRIVEFPRYAAFAQSFANTIPYSESIGFIADLRDKEDIDYVFFVTAHEVAHQWWGHQVVGANVQGATMLIESLAEYSALMVIEKEYGREHLRRFLKHDLDKYLVSRGGEAIEELPLYRVENQGYIHYNKGGLVFYRLRDEIGEEALNRALKRFLEDKGYQQPPYTTSKELLAYIRAETPADKQALITDLFEKIVFYDNRVLDASAKQRSDGKWEVTMKLHVSKIETDGKGKETPRAYDEPVEISVFARAPDAKESAERVLFAEKRMLREAEPTITVTVAEKPYEVGVDAYNKLIDRVSGDNRKKVSIQ